MRGGGVAGRGLRVGERELEPAPALALGRPVGEQAQRGGVEAGRGLRCRALQLRRRVAQQRDRVLVPGVGGVLDVMGALHGSGAAPLERLGRAGVGAEPPPRGRGDIDGVVRDRMPEREAPRHPGRPHEPGLQQLVERAQRRRLRQLRDRGGQLGCERVAHDRRGLEQRPRVRRELGVLGGERRRDGRRDRVVVHRSGTEPRRRAHTRELLEEERVAPAAGVDRGGDAADELGGLGRGQRCRPQRDHAVLAVGARERRRQAGGQLALTRRHREQDGTGGRAPDQRREGVERSGVRPLRIVDPQHESPRGGEPFEQASQRTVRAMAIGMGRLAAAQRRQHLRERRGLLHVTLERLRPERIRKVALGLRRPRAEHDRPLGGRALAEVVEQPGLADAGLALQREDRPLERPQRGRDRLTFLGTTDQRGSAHRRRAGLGHGRTLLLP